MSYSFALNISLNENVRLIALDQLDEGLARVKRGEGGPVETIHDLRKRCKKMRALLRLVFPNRGNAIRVENEWYRDTSMLLSDVRDVQISVEAFDQMAVSAEESGASSIVREFLVSRCRAVEEEGGGIDERLLIAKERFIAGRERIPTWPFEDVCSVRLQEGFLKAHRRAVKAMHGAQANATTETHHEWRKGAKNHWYHTRLLESLRIEEMTPYKESVYELTDILGSERDLFTLSEAISEMTPREEFRSAITRFQDQIRVKRTEMRAKSLQIGEANSIWNPVPVLERAHAHWGVKIDMIP